MTHLITLSNMAQFMLRGGPGSWQASTDRGATWVDVPGQDTPYRAAQLAALALGLDGEVITVAPQPDEAVLRFPFGLGTETQAH